MKESFTEFHRLIAEANQVIGKLTEHPEDSAIRIAQLHLIAALLEAQKQALHLENLLKHDTTLPPQ